MINLCIYKVVYLLNIGKEQTFKCLKNTGLFYSLCQQLKTVIQFQIGDDYRNTTENEFRQINSKFCLRKRQREKRKGAPYILSIAYTSHTLTIVLTHIFIDFIKNYLFMIIYI